MKKILVTLLSVFLLVALVGCRNGDISDEYDIMDYAREGTITVWCWDWAFNVIAMERAAEIYYEISPLVEINIIETSWGNIQNQIATAYASGYFVDLPDIMLVQNHSFQRLVINYPDIFADITDSGIPFYEFAPAKIEMSMVDGRNYGVPFDNGAIIMALRIDILEQVGLTMDDFTDITWDEFLELGLIILGQTGMPLVSVAAGGHYYMAVMLQSAGVELFHEDGTPNIADNDVIVEAIEIYLTMLESGVALEVENWNEYIRSFVNGEVAGTISGCWILGSIQSATDQAGSWRLTNIPRLDIPGGTNYSSWGGASWAISSMADTDLAVSFLRHTFAGSIELYETILPITGAIATWAPVIESEVYTRPQDFFGGQQVFVDIVGFSHNVPPMSPGIYYYEVFTAIGGAVEEILSGVDIRQALLNAQDMVEFQIN